MRSLAAAHFKKAITDEDTEQNALMQYEMARSMEETGESQKAVNEYLKVAYMYPGSKYWSVKARFRCAQIFEKEEQFDKAKRLYEKLADEPMDEGDLAKKRLAWLKGR